MQNCSSTDLALLAIQQSRPRIAIVCPTKALANQMFSTIWARLKLNEGSLGIITGAISYNADATIVVTIAQSLLRRLCENSFDSTAVVLDEFHSILKKEDGYIWENLVNLIPQRVQIVALTATLSHAHHVLKWLQSVHPSFEIIEMKESRPVKQEICVFARGELTRVPQGSILGSRDGGIDRTKDTIE